MDKSLWDKAEDAGAFNGLGRLGALLKLPEKKNKKLLKLCVQESTIPPISEYAPPIKTSSDNLVASNPFDDEYTIPSLSDYSCFKKPGYVKIEELNTFMMPPNSLQTPYRNGGLQNFRDHPLPFSKEISMSLGRSLSFINVPEKSPFENGCGLGQTIAMPGQHFRYNHHPHAFNTTSLNFGHQNGILHPSLYSPQNGQVHFYQHPVYGAQFQLAHPPFLHPEIPKIHSNPTAAEDQTPSDNITSKPATKPRRAKKQTVNSKKSQPESKDVRNGAQSTFSFSSLSKYYVSPREKCNRWVQESFNGLLCDDTVYPCGICSLDVNSNDDAIMCEVSCQKWFHRTCTGLTELAYSLLKAETSAVWGCDICMAKKDVQLVHMRK